MVVVGLHPNCDIRALENQYVARKFEGSGKLRSALSNQNQSRVEPNIEPQVVIDRKFCGPCLYYENLLECLL